MAGLLALLVVATIGYLSLVGWFSWWIAKRTTQARIRGVAFTVLFVALLVAPLGDEIVGKVMFDQLCHDATEVKVYETMPVGKDLYFPDGRWRLSSTPPLPREEFNRVQSLYESIVRFESSELRISPSPIPIYGQETRVFSRGTERLLASYRVYGTPGGWLSRFFEKPTLVSDQCVPRSFHKVGPLILPFNG